MHTSKRVDVLGVRVSAIDPAMALERITGWIERRERRYVCVTGVHGVTESLRDPELQRIHNESGLTTPDGMPMVWCGRRAGATWMRRVYGPDMMSDVLQQAAQRGWTSFLYGSTPDTLALLESRLVAKFPGLRIVGTWSPPFRDLSAEEELDMVQRINAAAPDLVWVGLSTPKQERWMHRHRDGLHAPVLLGVGAAFDFHAGVKRQAPRWMQRSGLEWLFRLASEPRRLWRRYLVGNTRFVMAIVRRRPRLVEDDRT